MTIHWLALLMNLTIANGAFHIAKAAASSIMFLPKVCQLVSLRASPKHPQSLTGFARAIHTVVAVIIAMKRRMVFDTSLLLMAKSSRMPRLNSKAARITDAPSVR